jgi:ketose-bisphosphate aldolase
MVKGLIKDLDIQQPVAIHLDHGTSYEACEAALEAGFTSVMYDGSHHPIEENVAETARVVELANKYNASVEAEVGTLGGSEDGIEGESMYAKTEEVEAIGKTGITMLAVAVGNAHGVYKGEVHLNMDLVKEFSDLTGLPLVLHGGSGIPTDQIQETIAKGMSKVNVNTELQQAFAKAVREYIEAEKDLDIDNAGYDPRKILAGPFQAMKDTVKEKFEIFGSIDKA